MKLKTKLLMPVIGLTSLAAITPALVSCGEVSKPTGQEFSVTIINGSTEGVSITPETVKEGEPLNATVKWIDDAPFKWIIDTASSKCEMDGKVVENAFEGQKVSINKVTGNVKLLIILTYDPSSYCAISLSNSSSSDLYASYTYQDYCEKGTNYEADITWTSWDEIIPGLPTYYYSWMTGITATDGSGATLSVEFQETTPNAAHISISNVQADEIKLVAAIRQVNYDVSVNFGGSGEAETIGNTNNFTALKRIDGEVEGHENQVCIECGGGWIPDLTNIEYSFDVGQLQAAISAGSTGKSWDDTKPVVISLLTNLSDEVTADHTNAWIDTISAKFRYNGTTDLVAEIQEYDGRDYLVIQPPEGVWGCNGNGNAHVVTGCVQYSRTSFLSDDQWVYPVVWQYVDSE